MFEMVQSMKNKNRDYSVSKNCSFCGDTFHKLKRDSWKQWESREFCSVTCAQKSKRPATSPHSRFWKSVKIRKNQCWEWTGNKDDKGYGTISTGYKKSPAKAHRISWEIHFGEIPKGLFVLHACDNPSCVNPKHLMIGSQQANAIDMSKKGRMSNESMLNLRPGESGMLGAGTYSNRERLIGIS